MLACKGMHSKVHGKHARTRGQLGGVKCIQRERRDEGGDVANSDELY